MQVAPAEYLIKCFSGQSLSHKKGGNQAYAFLLTCVQINNHY